jgi:hypothetical protein
MLRIVRGEGILPSLFTSDSAEKDARAGCPRHGTPAPDTCTACCSEATCIRLGHTYA